MKIAVAQFNYFIGDFEGNLKKMLASIDQAKNEQADLILFGELATCGYPPRDFLEFDDFITQCENSIDALREASKDIAIVVGSPTRNPRLEGKDLYNSAYFLAEGEVKYVQHKALLPTYDIFDEYRYFEPASEFGVVHFKGKKIALCICEDIWNVGNENPLYTICPLDEVMHENPDLILNCSASPFNFSHAAQRIHTLRANVARYKVPMFYANHAGGNTELIFDGGSLVMSPNGNVYDEMPYFKEETRVYELEKVLQGNRHIEQPKEKMQLIHDALVVGIKDYFEKTGLKSAVLGLSGGIDSAVTAALAVRALGKENVYGVMMPSEFSSQHSVDDAVALAKNLDIHYEIIPIQTSYQAFLDLLTPHFKDKPFNVTEENIQARCRGVILMGISNKFGHILLNTSNKSEMAVGYGTLYGDLCGGLAVLGDVYKTEVYQLANYINKNGIVVPLNTIHKAPSAELRPNQKDSDSLPEYDLLDKVLYQYIEKCQGPKELVQMGFEESLVKKVLRMVNVNEFKRHQAAPVLRVSLKAFGSGRRLPIVGKYLS